MRQETECETKKDTDSNQDLLCKIDAMEQDWKEIVTEFEFYQETLYKFVEKRVNEANCDRDNCVSQLTDIKKGAITACDPSYIQSLRELLEFYTKMHSNSIPMCETISKLKETLENTVNCVENHFNQINPVFANVKQLCESINVSQNKLEEIERSIQAVKEQIYKVSKLFPPFVLFIGLSLSVYLCT